jgi:hypothetical protein
MPISKKRSQLHTLSRGRGTTRHADQLSQSGAALTGEAVSRWCGPSPAHRKDRFHQLRLHLWTSSKFCCEGSAIIFSSFIHWSSHACRPAREWLQILFYEADVANEPPHVHVNKGGNEAKFWLKPIRVEREGSFRKSDLRDIERIIKDNHNFLLDVWEKERSKHANG